MRLFLDSFGLFRDLVGKRIYFLITLMLSAAIFEGLSVSVFLPVLQQAGGGIHTENPLSKFIFWAYQSVGLQNSLGLFLSSLVIFYFCRSLLLLFETAYVGKIQADMLVDLRSKNISRLFNATYQHFLTKDVGYLTNAFVREFAGVSGAFKMYASTLVRSIFVFLYLGFCLLISTQITLIALFVGFLSYPMAKWINEIIRDTSIDFSDRSADLQGILIQSLNHFKYFKATFTQNKIVQKVFEQSRRLGKLIYRQSFYSGLGQYGFQPAALLAIAVILYIKSKHADQNMMEVLFVLMLLQKTVSELLGLQQNYRKFLECTGSLKVFKRIHQELLTVESAEAAKTPAVPPDFSSPIIFKGVTFRYDKKISLIENVNLTLPPKSTVAFVGGSGVGKSTLVNLITGILSPVQGQVFLGDVDYRDIDGEALRANIGYIPQESVVFNDTLLNNVTLWDKSVDMGRLKASLERAHILDFALSQPLGFGTVLGDNGIKISGGQRQRIAIARELYKDAKIFIFDEATSSLDSQTEVAIQKDIDQLHGDKTVILIAHRLSTVKNSDIIFVLKDGQVVEYGRYEELCQNGSVFRSMLAMQRV